MAQPTYETIALLNDGRVESSEIDNYKIVDKSKSPDIYTGIESDEYIIPDKLWITLVDGVNSITKIGTNDVWSECTLIGGGGDNVTYEDVSNVSSPNKIVQYSSTGHVNTAIAEFPENAVPLAQMDVRVPELSLNQFLVNRGAGNVSGGLLALDFNITEDSVLRVPTTLGGNLGANGLPVSQSAASGGSMVRRTATGAIFTATATDNGHAVNLGQFQGIINDTLTASQTSAEMNGLYPSIAIGSEVTTKTNLTTYRKLDATTWEIRTITIV